jgi:hypothetical protein
MAPRELYCSPNGDRWLVARDPATDHGVIIHEPNRASGGRPTRIEVGAFLRAEHSGPEHLALLRLIGDLANGESAGDGPTTTALDR